MSHQKRSWLKWLSGTIIVLLLTGAVAFAFPTHTAYAQSGEPPAAQTPAVDKTGWRDTMLEHTYQVLLRFSQHVGRDYERIPTITERVNNLVSKIEEKGLDPTPIPQALADFQVKAAAHQADFENAAAILSSHAGFDDQGKVTDRSQAVQTVNQARQALQTAHSSFHDALRDLRQVLQKYRQAHRPPTPES